MGLSIRAYARYRGVSHVAVKKAIDTGRITPEPDGTIEPNRADLEWAQNTLASRKAPVAQAAQTPPVLERAAVAQVAAAPSPVGAAQSPVSALSAGGTSLLQARTVNEVLKAKIRQVELAEKKDELVERAQAVAHVFAMARTEREAWLNWPSRISAQMAAKLEVDAHELHVALDSAVREHLIELGELHARVD